VATTYFKTSNQIQYLEKQLGHQPSQTSTKKESKVATAIATQLTASAD
jgi:hypothetical protein